MLELTFQKSREENEKSGSAGVGVNTAIKQKQNKKNRQKDRLRMEKMEGRKRGVTQEVISSSWQQAEQKQEGLKKKEWMVSQSRSGGTTPALPLPKILPLFLSLAPPFPEKTGEEILAVLPLAPTQSVPSPPFLSLSLFLSLVISFSHFPFSSLPKTIFIPRSFFPQLPSLLPFLVPDTTKSAACGLNGNQTLTHSSKGCRLLPCTFN